MKTAEVMKKSFEARGLPPNKVAFYLDLVGRLMQKKALIPLQVGDTVFLLVPKSPGEAEVHISTVEPQRLAERFKEALPLAQQMGWKKLGSTFDRPGIAQLLKQSGVPAQISMTHQAVKGQARPAYRAEITLNG